MRRLWAKGHGVSGGTIAVPTPPHNPTIAVQLFPMNREARVAQFAKMPKIELHLHLEGSIPYDALWELA